MRTGKSLFGCMIQRRDRDSGDIFRGQQWDAFDEKSRVLRREEQNTRGSDHEMVFIRRGGRLIGRISIIAICRCVWGVIIWRIFILSNARRSAAAFV